MGHPVAAASLPKPLRLKAHGGRASTTFQFPREGCAAMVGIAVPGLRVPNEGLDAAHERTSEEGEYTRNHRLSSLLVQADVPGVVSALAYTLQQRICELRERSCPNSWWSGRYATMFCYRLCTACPPLSICCSCWLFTRHRVMIPLLTSTSSEECLVKLVVCS